VTNDDLRLANDMQSGGLVQEAKALWGLSVMQGRPHIAKILSQPLPFLIDASWYFKSVTFAIIALNAALFGLLAARLAGSWRIGVAATAVWLMIVCHHDEGSPLVFNPGIFTTATVYLMLGLWLSIRPKAESRIGWDVFAAFLLLAAFLTYELFTCYGALPWVVFIARSGWRRWKEGPWWPTAALVVALITYAAFRHLGSYPGTDLALDGMKPIVHTTIVYAKAGLPGYPYDISGPYRLFLRNIGEYYPHWPLLVPIWLMKAAGGCALIWYAFTTLPSTTRSLAALAAAAVVSVAYLALPVLPYALSPYYRQVVAAGATGVIGSYYSTFATAALFVIALLFVARITSVVVKRLAMALILAGLAATSVLNDALSWIVGDIDARAYARVILVRKLVKSPAWDAIPDHATIFAPSLYTASWILTFNGAPSLAYSYPPALSMYGGINDWWTWRIVQDGGKSVEILKDRMDLPAPAARTIYALEYKPGEVGSDSEGSIALSRCRCLPDGTLHAEKTTIFTDDRRPAEMVFMARLDDLPRDGAAAAASPSAVGDDHVLAVPFHMPGAKASPSLWTFDGQGRSYSEDSIAVLVVALSKAEQDDELKWPPIPERK
jgi:hypothetical protein